MNIIRFLLKHGRTFSVDVNKILWCTPASLGFKIQCACEWHTFVFDINYKYESPLMSQISAYNSSFFFFINIVMLSYKYPSWNTVYNFWQPYINEMGVRDFFIIDPSCRLYALTTWKIFSKIILQHLLYNRIFSSLDLSWIRNGVYYSERNVCMRVSHFIGHMLHASNFRPAKSLSFFFCTMNHDHL